jgi:DNA (cytosine-5)-methyltransferase 1
MDLVDLFAGAGGWDVAARHLGLSVARVETNPSANATAAAAGFATLAIRNALAVSTAGYDGIVASPPCQPFSAAAKDHNQDAQRVLDAVTAGTWGSIVDMLHLGRACRDKRSMLALVPLYHVNQTRPAWTAWEQVPGVLPLWRACAAALKSLGYHTWCGVLHAEAYGVPQTRRRAVLIAADHPVGQPAPTHSRYYPRNKTRRDVGVKNFVTLEQALGEVSVLSTYSTNGDYTNRGSREHTEPAATVTTKTSRNKMFGDRPATTVVASHSPEYLAAPGWRTRRHRQDADGSIRISPAQAGVLQSFPPDYPWRGTVDQKFTQIGNAIPPLLAGAIIKEALRAGPGQ